MFIIEGRLVGVLAALAVAAGGALLSLKGERPAEDAPLPAVAAARGTATLPSQETRGPVAAPVKVIAILRPEHDMSGRRLLRP